MAIFNLKALVVTYLKTRQRPAHILNVMLAKADDFRAEAIGAMFDLLGSCNLGVTLPGGILVMECLASNELRS